MYGWNHANKVGTTLQHFCIQGCQDNCGVGAQGKCKKNGAYAIDCLRGVWGHASMKFCDFTCSEVCSAGLLRLLFTQYVHTTQLPYLFSSFRSKSMMHRAL